MTTDFLSSIVAAILLSAGLFGLGRWRDAGTTRGNKGWSTLIIVFVLLAIILIFGRIIFGIQGWNGLLYFALMTLGAVAKWLWDAIKSAGNNDPELKPKELILPIIVSPFIYSAVLSGLAGLQPGPNPTAVQQFAPFLLAFQNGFFWQTVFDQFNPNK
jgi:hypothetical protein